MRQPAAKQRRPVTLAGAPLYRERHGCAFFNARETRPAPGRHAPELRRQVGAPFAPRSRIVGERSARLQVTAVSEQEYEGAHHHTAHVDAGCPASERSRTRISSWGPGNPMRRTSGWSSSGRERSTGDGCSGETGSSSRMHDLEEGPQEPSTARGRRRRSEG